MKIGILTLFALVTVAQLEISDNWLSNGDFTSGIDHWRGNGRAPSDYTESSLDKPDPMTTQGLIIELKHATWSKVEQNFHSHGGNGILSVTFKVSPDIQFSSKPEDYQNMTHAIGYDGYTSYATKPGNWVVFISDLHATSEQGSVYEIEPKAGSSNPQTVQFMVENRTPKEEKSIALCFPPGDGKIAVLNISITDAPDKASQ